jgi:hypothetical protein
MTITGYLSDLRESFDTPTNSNNSSTPIRLSATAVVGVLAPCLIRILVPKESHIEAMLGYFVWALVVASCSTGIVLLIMAFLFGRLLLLQPKRCCRGGATVRKMPLGEEDDPANTSNIELGTQPCAASSDNTNSALREPKGPTNENSSHAWTPLKPPLHRALPREICEITPASSASLTSSPQRAIRHASAMKNRPVFGSPSVNRKQTTLHDYSGYASSRDEGSSLPQIDAQNTRLKSSNQPEGMGTE